MAQDDHGRLGLSAGLASVVVALVLVLLKLWALWATGALSIAASLADSALDLLMSIGAALAIVYAARPADEDHAFGHSSIEDLAALAQALVVCGSGVAIITTALTRFSDPHPPEISAETAGIFVMVVSILLTAGLVWWQGHVAAKTGNRVVAADRLHYLGDLLPSLGAILALLLSSQFGLAGADTIIAILAGLFMLRGAFSIGKGAWDALMDRAAPQETLALIHDIAGKYQGVRGHHDLKTRTSGSKLFIALHIELDGEQSLREAHDISAGLKLALKAALPNAEIIIHKDVASPRT